MSFSDNLHRDRANVVAAETVTMPSNSDDVTSSVIDFHRTDRALTFICNEQGTSLNNDADVDLLASADGSNFGVIKSDIVTSLDGGVAVATFDPESGGPAPYYKLRVDPDGTMSQSDVDFAVIQNDQNPPT